MQIKDLAIGDGYVHLMEDGAKVKFYALCHNYESSINGTGRTLFCRESPASLTLNKFTAAVQKWISTTSYKYQYTESVFGHLTNVQIGSANFFPLSAIELGMATDYYTQKLADGSALSAAARTRVGYIRTASNTSFWTRSPDPRSSGYHKEDGDNVYDYDYYYAVTGASGSSISFSKFDRYKTSLATLPCFTLPENLYIDNDGFATENEPPEVTSDAGASGAELGEKNAPFTVGYTVTDGDGDTLTITEKLDGKTTKTRTNIASGTALTFEQAADAAGFQRVLNGSHTLTLEADDGKTTTDWTATFTKSVTSASVTLTEPLTVEGDITVAVLQVTGSIPDDAVFRAEVTNNANDPSPVWQDATTEVQKGVNVVFDNKTATAGAAFNFRVSISRGASGTGGYIEAVSGAFQ